jgi:inositol 1,4,5-triphosphate receptor type 1
MIVNMTIIVNRTITVNRTKNVNITIFVNRTIIVNRTIVVNRTIIVNRTMTVNRTIIVNRTSIVNRTLIVDRTIIVNRTITVNRTIVVNRTLNPSQVQKHIGLKMYNTLALPTSLYGFETRAIREQDKSRITSAEMKFMGRMAQYTWQDYKTNDDILSELKIKRAEKEIQNYGNYMDTTFSANGQRQTDRLPHLIMKCQPCGKRSQEQRLKRLLE